MGALLAIRSQRAISVFLGALLIIIWLGHFATHNASPASITDRIPENIKNYLPGKPVQPPKPNNGPSSAPANGNIERTIAAASNSTLGFSKIRAIHMKHRWDKWDASVLQAYVSGLDLEYYEGVDGKVEIEDAGRVGLPPGSGRHLSSGELACYRSHANLWSDLVRSRGPPIMIFESDAAWDVNIRGVMGTALKPFLEYLAETNSKPADAPPYAREKIENRPADRKIEYNPDDPWQSEHWDVFTLGHCSEAQNFYDDKTHPRKEYKDQFEISPLNPLGTNRVLSRSTGWACTTAYAVSHRGAAKMLLRHALDLNEPLDLVMKGMIDSGELISYAIHPRPVLQWGYHENIGMKKGASSSLFALANPEEDAKSAGEDMSGWDEVKKLKSPYVFAEAKFGKGVKFKTGALANAWETIFNPGAQFTMPDIGGVDVAALQLEHKGGEGDAKPDAKPVEEEKEPALGSAILGSAIEGPGHEAKPTMKRKRRDTSERGAGLDFRA